MKAFTKLGLLIGLVVAVIGTAPASAFGTTITSNGSAYSGPLDTDTREFWFFWENGYMASCHSEMSGTIASDGTGQITSWNFSGCFDPIVWTSVSLEARDLPYDIEVEHTSGNDGTLTITSPITFRFTGWNSYLNGCELTAAAGATAAEVTGGLGAEVHFSEQTLTGRFGHQAACGGEAIWDLSHMIDTPDDLRVEP